MLNGFRSWLVRLLGGQMATAAAEPEGVSDAIEVSHQTHAVPFDEQLLERARNQWLVGDWAGLAEINRETLQHHPDRAKIALLAAAGLSQTGQAAEARQFTQLAIDWGCAKKLVSQVLISGVHNTLGRVSAMAGLGQKALPHFEKALAIGSPGSASPAITRARSTLQLDQLLANRSSALVLVQSVSEALVTVSNSGIGIQLPSPTGHQLAQHCMAASDIHSAVDEVRSNHLANLDETDRFSFYLALSDGLLKNKKDRMTALSYLQYAKRHTSDWTPAMAAAIVTRLISLGQANLAAEFLTQMAIQAVGPICLTDGDQKAIQAVNAKLHEVAGQKGEHGHDLLLAALAKQVAVYKSKVAPRQPVLIEIGTTREDVPGQGSSRKIALFCKQHGISFTTVDMDPHNSLLAREMFAEIGSPQFLAITMKGEDYLRDFQGEIDFVFLDAYDFDHGMHSEVRQSRYEQFLGSRIDETQCHQMHLDCAQSVHAKLAPEGLVCVDDTWLDNGKWTAKGTLAMPYLLANGFELLEARNRAALLRRQGGST